MEYLLEEVKFPRTSNYRPFVEAALHEYCTTVRNNKSNHNFLLCTFKTLSFLKSIAR